MASAYKQKAKSAKKNKECDDLYEAYENLKNAGGDAKAVADLKKKADAAREKTDAGRKAATRPLATPTTRRHLAQFLGGRLALDRQPNPNSWARTASYFL